MSPHYLDSILRDIPVGQLDEEGNMLSMAEQLSNEQKDALYKEMQRPDAWDAVKTDATMLATQKHIMELIQHDALLGKDAQIVEREWKEVLRREGIIMKIRELLASKKM